MLRVLALVLSLLAASPALAETVHFAGYDWLVRDYPGGPGPNIWDSGNAFVDADGLHLRLSRTGGVWSAGEVVMLGPPLGFGTYDFAVSGPLGRLDRNIVLGLFNYPTDASADGTNEIDIELSQWGSADNPHRLNWTVHAPVAGTEAAHRDAPLPKPKDGTTSFRFAWSADAIDYAAAAGPDAGAAPAQHWRYAPADAAAHIPQQPLVVHMNLWLLDGTPPADGNPTEVVIRTFSFTPG